MKSPTGRLTTSLNLLIQADAADEMMADRRAKLEELGAKFGEGVMADFAKIELSLVERHMPEFAAILDMPPEAFAQMLGASRFALLYGAGNE